MAILIGHASISENGTINGTKGDQTGKEVCIRDFYSKPWDYVAIHPDANVREKHAKAVEAGCANDNIGYGQGDRNTLNTEAKKVGYDLSKITTPCNTDCSEFMNVCAVASGAPGVTHASNGWTTSTMKSALQAAGYKIITSSTYLTSADYCVRGAIYVKSGSHTVCGLSNGSKYNQTLSAAGLSSSSSTTSSNTSSSTYTVEKGDTLSGIGTKLKINWKTIADLNGIKSPYIINVGQVLKLPTSTYSTSNSTSSTTTSSLYTKTQFIKDVQSATGAKVDGISGSETLSKTPTVSKSKNTKHAVVKPIQKYLNTQGYDCGNPDGIAGTKFDAAVKKYQKDHGCVVDGEITAQNNTWKSLLGLR